GTFKITYKGVQTGSLNWNDSSATVQSAVNGLSTVIADGLTLTVTNSLSTAGSVSVSRPMSPTWNTSDFSIDVSSLTPACITSTVGSSPGLATDFYVARSAINLNKVAHGLTAAQAFRWLIGTTGGGTLASVA